MEKKGGSGVGALIGLLAAGGLAWWLYESGIFGSLFGTSTTTTTTTTTPTTTSTVSGSGAGTNATPATSGPCPTTGVLSQALALAATAQSWSDPNDPTHVLTMDQWNYYLNQVCTGLPNQVGAKLDAAQVFPNDSARGGPINWTAYQGYAQQAGLSGLRGSGAGTRVHRRGVACCS